MKTSIILSVAVLGMGMGVGVGEEPAKPAADRNVYLFDSVWLDAFDQWKPIGRATFRIVQWNSFEPNRMLDVRFDACKVGQMIHGVQRRGLGLPLPQAVRFRVWTDGLYLWMVLGDKAGRRLVSPMPLPGVGSCKWSQMEVSLSDMYPMGVGAERIRDLDMIAVVTQESAGEIDEEPIRMCLSRFEAVYPKGTGPTNPTFTRQDLDAMLGPLPPMIDRVDALLAQAKAKGIDVRYPTVSRTVLHRYRGEVGAMIPEKDPFLARRTAEFLLECARRTQAELEGVLADPNRAIRVPDVSLKNLVVKEGSFFSGDRPVMLAGVCGWFNPNQFEHLSPMGYTAISAEIGPSATLPEENKTNPEGVSGIRAILDACARHNMVCDLLVSPHYFPDWARKKWPETDATGWRRKTNEFMPWSLTDPNFRAVIARHLSVLIPLVREHPSLISYDLLNEAWYRTMPDFPASQWTDFRKQNPQLDEWQALSRITTQNVTEFLRWFIAELHKHDRAHPVQIKAFDTPEMLGVDREAVSDVLTADGMDAMPSYPEWSGRLAADFSWSLLRHDFHRSLTPEHVILDGEFHISDGLYPTPSAYFRAALWALALHGRDMTACWVQDRVDDVSLYWHANGVEVLGRTSLDLVRLAPEIHAFQRQRSPLALYYGGLAIGDAYLAALFQDLNVGVITDRRIVSGRLSDYRLLVVPAGSRMPPDVRKRVEAFRQSGGMVVVCPTGAPVEQVWAIVHRAVEQAKLSRAVRTDRWGVECRGITLGSRKLLYVLNHLRKPVEIALKSDWPLSGGVDLRTGERVDAGRFRLDRLDFRLIEVR